jgi:HlyD family secretion protein
MSEQPVIVSPTRQRGFWLAGRASEGSGMTAPTEDPRLRVGLTSLLMLLLTTGCQRVVDSPQNASAKPVEKPALTIRLVHPQKKTVTRHVEQPGFNAEAYQETALFAHIPGYVKSWKSDIGDTVSKDQVLAELNVPEMVATLAQKEAAIRLAEAQVGQAKASLATAMAQESRTRGQYDRLAKAGQGGVLDRESVEEARLGAEAAKAATERAKADVTASEAQVEVARAERDHALALVKYATIRAPFEGVVTRRTVSVGDFVQPAGAAGKGQPLYVVQQPDPLRVVVNVPAADAPWLRVGDPVSFRLQGAGGELFQGKVTRTARSLDPQARTLRTEIDVPNSDGKLLPGTYVQATITIRHDGVWALPATAIVTEGDQTFCYRVEGGKAVRTPLQLGLHGDGLVEVLRKQTKPESWDTFTGSEECVENPVGISDCQPIGTAG